MIDYQCLYRGFRGYQFEAELVLYGGKEAGKIGVRVRGIVRGPFQRNRVVAGQFRLVKDDAVLHRGQYGSQIVHRCGTASKLPWPCRGPGVFGGWIELRSTLCHDQTVGGHLFGAFVDAQLEAVG